MIHNIIFNILYHILNIVIPLITAPYLSRVMAPSQIGIYAYSNSICGIISVFMLLGIANYGSRTIAINVANGQKEHAKTFWELYAMQLISSLIGLTCYVAVILTSTEEYVFALIAQSFYLIAIMLDISWYFTGIGQIKKAVMRGGIIKILQTIAIFCCVKAPDDLLLYILIISVGTLVGNVALWVMAWENVRFVKVSIRSIIPHFKANLVLFIPLLASSMFIYTDKLMLGIIASSADLGIYEYAEKIVRIPLLVISAIGTVMMPYVSGLVSRNDDTMCHKCWILTSRYISLLACAMSLGLLAVGPELAEVYLGAEFAESGQLIQIMSCIVLFSSLANIIRTQWLIPRGEDKKYAGSIVGGAMINLCLNAFLIPSLGSVGAAIGTIGAEMMILICHICAIRKELKLGPTFRVWGYSLLRGGVMFVVVEFATSVLRTGIIKLLVGVLVGVFVFTIQLLWQMNKDNLNSYLKGRCKR